MPGSNASEAWFTRIGAAGLSTGNTGLFCVESTKPGICLLYSHWVGRVVRRTLEDTRLWKEARQGLKPGWRILSLSEATMRSKAQLVLSGVASSRVSQFRSGLRVVTPAGTTHF